MPVEAVTRSICDLALRFGEGVNQQKVIMVSLKNVFCVYILTF